MTKLIIEARINEYMMRDVNPNVPWTSDEIAESARECREAGASVVHFHARNPDGSPGHAYELYRDAVAAIRARTDVLIHPTLGYVTLGAPAEERFAHIARMMTENGAKPDFSPMDMGSTNVDWWDPHAKRFKTDSLIYQNSTGTLAYFAGKNREYGLKPYLVAWNIGFTRQATAFMRAGLLDEPAYLCFLLSDNDILAGHPGTLKGLQAHVDFLPADKHVEWTVCNYEGNLLQLVGAIIAMGGHISIGLGDYPYAELGRPRNADVIARVVQMAKDLGRDVATPQETKQILRMN